MRRSRWKVCGPCAPDCRASLTGDADATERTQYGSYLAAVAFASAGSGLHHKICHVLGGAFGLPHAATHAIVLPHVLAFNAPFAAAAADRIAAALGSDDASDGLRRLRVSVDAPRALRDVGLREDDIARAVSLILPEVPPSNPRPVDATSLSALLRAAWSGADPRPTQTEELAMTATETDPSTQQGREQQLVDAVVASLADTPDERLKTVLTALVEHLHAFIREVRLTEGGVAAGDRLPHPRRAYHRRQAAGVHPALRRPRRLDADDHRQRRSDRAHDRGHRRRPVLRRELAARRAGRRYLRRCVRRAVLGRGPRSRYRRPAAPRRADRGVGGRRRRLLRRPVPGRPHRPRVATSFTDDHGRYRFWALTPTPYPIPADGPVGDLLAATRRSPMRAPHLHFMVSHPGQRTLVTHIFVAGDDLRSDSVFGIRDSLIVDFTRAPGTEPTPDGRVVDGTWARASFDLVLASGS